MAEELNDASDIKRLIGKNKGEEDPLLVAQRFLNIFRQLHIFDQKRRDEFNSMILALSPEVRGSFGILPGGSILQEYVDELEISKGITKSSSIIAPPPSVLTQTQDNESPLSKIKNAQQQEAPIAPINISGNAKLVADASFAQTLSQSVSNALMAAQASQNVDFDKLIEAIKDNPSNAKIVPDEKFATTMAKAFSQALHYSDASKKADIKELIEAVKESRKIELPEGFSFGGVSENGGSTPLIADETAFARTIAMAVAKVVHDSNNNANLGTEIRELANAVRESRKLELPEGFALGAPNSPPTPLIANEASFAQAIAMAVAKVVHDSNNNANLSTEIKELAAAIRESRKLELPEGFTLGTGSGFAGPLISDEAAFARTIAEAMAKVVNVGASAATSSPDIRELANALRESNSSNAEAISQAMVNSLTPLLISLEKNNNNNQFILDKINVIADHNFAEVIAKAFSQTFEISEQKHLEQTERLITGIQNAIINHEPSTAFVSDTGNYVPTVNNEQLGRITQDFTETLKSINENHRFENQEISKAIKETGKELLQMFEKQNANKNLQDKEMINEIISNVAQAQLGIFQEMAKQQTAELSNILSIALKENSKITAENTKKAQKNRSIFNFATLKPNDTSIDSSYNLDDAGIQYSATDKKETHSTVKEKKSSIAKYIKNAFERPSLEETETTSGSDWGFSTTNETQTENLVSETDTSITTEINHDTDNKNYSSENENEEWTWEYETTETAGDEGTDWEWEYEEDPSSTQENNEQKLEEGKTTEIDGVEGADWEWEYDDSVELSGEEGTDWEWEYEENESSESQNIESEDWEWEYEEEDNTTTNFANTEISNKTTNIITDESSDSLLASEVTPFQEHGEIMIAELRRQQNFVDPYLCENISV